jgi:hypothetical protein
MRRLQVLLVMLSLLFVAFNCQKKAQKPAVEQRIEQPAVVDTTVQQATPVDTSMVQ